MQGSALTCQAKEIRRVKAASPLEKQTGNNQIVGQLKRRGELYSMESEKQKQRQELPWFSQRMRSSWFQHKSTFCNTKKRDGGGGEGEGTGTEYHPCPSHHVGRLTCSSHLFVTALQLRVSLTSFSGEGAERLTDSVILGQYVEKTS